MTKSKKICPHCHASMMEHRHTISYAMVYALKRLAECQGPTNIKFLGLTRNQWDNFQKLRYWGLVERVFDEKTGRRSAGVWLITRLGRDFLDLKVSIPKNVWTYRGDFIRAEEVFVFAVDIDSSYKLREQYADEARPHEGEY